MEWFEFWGVGNFQYSIATLALANYTLIYKTWFGFDTSASLADVAVVPKGLSLFNPKNRYFVCLNGKKNLKKLILLVDIKQLY